VESLTKDGESPVFLYIVDSK